MKYNKEIITEEINSIKEKLKGNTIYITGHKNSDYDSYLSVVLVDIMLSNFGINAIRVFEDVNYLPNVDLSSLKPVLGDYIPMANDLPSDSYIFLVDHNNKAESYPNIKQENVLGVIDHHIDDSPISLMKYVGNSGSTTKIVYQMLKELDIEFDNYDYEVLISILLDTKFLLSTKTSQDDIDFAGKLLKILDLDIEKLKDKFLITTDLSQKTEILATNDRKSYTYGDRLVNTSVIEYQQKDSELLVQKLYDIVNYLRDEKSDLSVLILTNLTNLSTIVYYITNFDYEIVQYPYIASRAITIIPEIQERLGL